MNVIYNSLQSAPRLLTPKSNADFVSFPAPSAKQQLSAQALVLLGLSSPLTGPPNTSPLVSVSLCESYVTPLRRSLTKKSGKRALTLRVVEDSRSLKELLLPKNTYFLSDHLIKRREVHLDEGHLHSTFSDWGSKTELNRFLVVASSMGSSTSFAFSVNFSDRRQTELNKDISRAFRRLRNQISTLIAIGKVMITLERDADGRLHLHGMISTIVGTDCIKAALHELGGYTSNRYFRNLHQVKLRPTYCTLGWGLYMAKELASLPDDEVSSLMYVSRSALQDGLTHLDNLKGLAHSKLGVAPQWRGRATVYAQSGIQIHRSAPASATRH